MMRNLKFILLLILFSYSITAREVNKEQNNPVEDENSEQVETRGEAEKREKPEKNTNEKEKLKNFSYSKYTTDEIAHVNPLQYTMIRFFYGAVTGFAAGTTAGLYQYSSSDTTTVDNLLFYGAIGSITGAGIGTTVAIIELLSKSNDEIGQKFFRFSAYGLFIGSAVGALAGLIPYAQSQSADDIVNGVGFGAMGGVAAGLIGAVFLPQSILNHINFNIDDRNFKLTYHHTF